MVNRRTASGGDTSRDLQEFVDAVQVLLSTSEAILARNDRISTCPACRQIGPAATRVLDAVRHLKATWIRANR